MEKSIEAEVLNDFKTTLKNINFKGYNPNSSEFINSVLTGIMWRLVHNLLEDESDEIEAVAEYEDITEKPDEIQEELNGAKKYLQKYIDTGDSIFKDMCLDDLKHANILIKKSYAKLPNNQQKEKLHEYEETHCAIMQQVQKM